MSGNQLIPFSFAALPVRGALVQLDTEWRDLLARQSLSTNVAPVLGHATAAAPLITQGLKDGTSITLQISGDGPLSLLVMQCTSTLEFRGLATSSDAAAGLGFAGMTAGARCAITIEHPAAERPYQGIVEVDHASLAESLEGYFDRSAQLPSRLVLIADEQCCGGLLLQQMPGRSAPLEDDWRRLGLLAETLALRDIESGATPELLGRLFAEDDLRVHAARPVRFRCRCSRERAANALKLLGPEECALNQDDKDRIVVTCEYCGSREGFDAFDIASLFSDTAAPTSGRVH